MNSVKRVFLSATLLGCFIFCTGITFKDKQLNMVLDNLSRWHMVKVDHQEYQITGAGTPIRGSWKSQGLTVQALSLEGLIRSGRGQRLELIKATLKGDVVVDLASHLKAQAEPRKTYLKSQEIQYSQQNLQILLPLPFTLTSTYPEESQTLSLSGKKATLFLLPKKNTLKEGTIKGPVHLKAETLTRSPSKKEVFSKILIESKADQMEISKEGLQITMLGNVHIKGEQEAFSGEAEADQAIIYFNEKREIIEIDLKGNPGKTVLQKEIR